MELIEVAPGIDIERDILAQMDFEPIVDNPKPWTCASSMPRRWDSSRFCSASE